MSIVDWVVTGTAFLLVLIVATWPRKEKPPEIDEARIQKAEDDRED